LHHYECELFKLFDKGIAGPQGARGTNGLPGPKGEQGDIGIVGPQGVRGAPVSIFSSTYLMHYLFIIMPIDCNQHLIEI
jgi:hypothetical protein